MVDRQYLDFSTVAPTATQRSTWLADLAAGTKTPVDLVAAAEQLPYWQQQSPVIRLYLGVPIAGSPHGSKSSAQ